MALNSSVKKDQKKTVRYDVLSVLCQTFELWHTKHWRSSIISFTSVFIHTDGLYITTFQPGWPCDTNYFESAVFTPIRLTRRPWKYCQSSVDVLFVSNIIIIHGNFKWLFSMLSLPNWLIMYRFCEEKIDHCWRTWKTTLLKLYYTLFL